MGLQGLVLRGRRKGTDGVVEYTLLLDPELEARGSPSPYPQGQYPPKWAVEGLLVHNLAGLRLRYPHLILFTNDRPRDDSSAKTHLSFPAGVLDRTFMGWFPHVEVHVDYARPPEYFRHGPKVHCRLLDVTGGDLLRVWDGVLAECPMPVIYLLLFSSKPASLQRVAETVEGCSSSDAFESEVLNLVDLMAYVFELPWLRLLTKDPRVKVEVEGTVVQQLREAGKEAGAPVKGP